MVKAFIFDLDNTLIDFMRMKRLSCEAAMDAMISAGLSIDKKKGLDILFNLYHEYGFEYQKIFQVFMRKVLGRIDYGIMACGIVAYRRVKEGLVYPYTNAFATLMELKKKHRLVILSDAPRMQAWLRLAAMGMHEMFDFVITFDDTKQKKPGRKPFLLALKKLGLEPSECVMVGDSLKKDMTTAKKMGFRTVFARYGGNIEPAMVTPDYEIDNIKDLLRIRF